MFQGQVSLLSLLVLVCDSFYSQINFYCHISFFEHNIIQSVEHVMSQKWNLTKKNMQINIYKFIFCPSLFSTITSLPTRVIKRWKFLYWKAPDKTCDILFKESIYWSFYKSTVLVYVMIKFCFAWFTFLGKFLQVLLTSSVSF